MIYIFLGLPCHTLSSIYLNSVSYHQLIKFGNCKLSVPDSKARPHAHCMIDSPIKHKIPSTDVIVNHLNRCNPCIDPSFSCLGRVYVPHTTPSSCFSLTFLIPPRQSVFFPNLDFQFPTREKNLSKKMKI